MSFLSNMIAMAAFVVTAVEIPLACHGQTLTTLYSFKDGADGGYPGASVIYEGGVLYGTTQGGGLTDEGTVFAVDASTGVERVLHSFAGGKDGVAPFAGLYYRGGALFGTTSTQTGGTTCKGGACGTVFRVNAGTGAEKVLQRFDGADGMFPDAGLIYQDGFFYGTTVQGGAAGFGTVFKFNSATHAVTVLYSFTGGADGGAPESALIYLAGALYGTAQTGGIGNKGVVFSVDATTGAETVLHQFAGGTDGANPYAGLTYLNGALFGATVEGGVGAPRCQPEGCGTVFSINLGTGTETVLHSFGATRGDGIFPYGTLTYHGGMLFGTAGRGGHSGGGAIYRIDPISGHEKVLYDFTDLADGGYPIGGLIYHGGVFFGTTSQGSASNCVDCGTVFRFTP